MPQNSDKIYDQYIILSAPFHFDHENLGFCYYCILSFYLGSSSRMESSGEAGKVNIIGSTFALVKDKFKCIQRGKIQAKNKGEIEMYFVEGVG